MDTNILNKKRDRITKAINRNLKLLAWLCWSQDILFSDYSYDEMLDYIHHATDNELSQFIKPVQLRIFAKDESGFILDNHFGIYEHHALERFLNIEDQLNRYPRAEINARTVYYSCGIIFWQGERLTDKKNYRKIKPVTSIWIFPRVSNKEKNSIVFGKTDLFDKFKKCSFEYPEESKAITPDWKTEIDTVYFNLGNPANITNKKEFTGDKNWYAMILMDCLFGYDVELKVRQEVLNKMFYLTGRLTDEVIEEMNALEQFAQDNFNDGVKYGESKALQEGIQKGKAEGIQEGRAEERKNIIKILAQNIIKNSNNKLSMDEALAQAKKLITESV